MHPNAYHGRISTVIILHWNVWKWMCLLSGKCEFLVGSFKIEQIEKCFTTGHSEQESLCALVYFLRKQGLLV